MHISVYNSVCECCLLSAKLFTESHPLPPLLVLFFSEALGKMKDVYEKNPQMGDPASLAPQINQTSQNIERLRGELNKYEVILWWWGHH